MQGYSFTGSFNAFDTPMQEVPICMNKEGCVVFSWSAAPPPPVIPLPSRKPRPSPLILPQRPILTPELFAPKCFSPPFPGFTRDVYNSASSGAPLTAAAAIVGRKAEMSSMPVQPQRPKRKLPAFFYGRSAEAPAAMYSPPVKLNPEPSRKRARSLSPLPEEPKDGSDLCDDEGVASADVQAMMSVHEELEVFCALCTREGMQHNGVVPDNEWEEAFDLSTSGCMDYASKAQIFRFIWCNIKDHDTYVYRRVGIAPADRARLVQEKGLAHVRDLAEYFLCSCPKSLRDVMGDALNQTLVRSLS